MRSKLSTHTDPPVVKIGSRLKQQLESLASPDRLGRSVAQLAGSSAGAIALNLLMMPVLTRLYTPSDFGLLSVYVALQSPLLIIATFRYTQAIPIPKRHVHAVNLAALSLLVSTLTCIALAIVLHLWNQPFSRLLNAPILRSCYWLLPVTIFGASLYTTFNMLAVRGKHFKEIASTNLRQCIVKLATQCVLGMLHFGPVGLLIGDTAGQTAGAGKLAKLATTSQCLKWSDVAWRRIAIVARTYASFPTVTMPNALINSLTVNLPLFAIPIIYGSDVAGWCLLTYRLAAVPIGLFITSVSQVFYAELTSSRVDMTRQSLILRSTVSRLLLIGILFSLPVYLTSIYWLPFLLGEVWRPVGYLLAITSPMWIAQLVISPVNMAYIAKNVQTPMLVIDTARLLSSTCMLAMPLVADISIFSLMALIATQNVVVYVTHWLVLSLVVLPSSRPAAAEHSADTAACDPNAS